MLRSFWRSIDRFSIQHFRYLVNELQDIKVVDSLNREFVVDLLRSIVEIVTYGDHHDPTIFECFMEHQLLAQFLRVLKISRNSSIDAQLLHYLSIMIQNMGSEHAICKMLDAMNYCLSNEYINNIIMHPYNFDGGDLAMYYISFLRTVSGKLNRDTLCLLVKVQEDAVVSFPLYTEALKFASHEEQMIQIAVRALTLNIYNVSDEMVFKFITTPPVSEYFSDVVLNLRKQCFHLDALVCATKDAHTRESRKRLLLQTDKIVDDLYYCKDILLVGESYLSRLMTQNLLSLLVLPILLSLLQLNEGTHLSAITSLYIVSRLVQVVEGKKLANSVAIALLYPYMSGRVATERSTISETSPANSFLDFLNEMEVVNGSVPESEGAESIGTNYLFGNTSSSSHFFSCVMPMDGVQRERDVILSLIFSDNHSLLLASLMLLLVLSESKDLDYFLSSIIGFSEKKTVTEKHLMASDISLSLSVDANIFVRHIPQILNALLKLLASQPECSVLAQWNTVWVLRKLLICQEMKLTDHDLDLLNISYERSCERLMDELNGCWFDCVAVTLKSEWERCKTALEESSLSKDPYFFLELSFHNQILDGNISSSVAWERMVDAVKVAIINFSLGKHLVFVLHHQLKAFIVKGSAPENPLLQLGSDSMGISGRTNSLDVCYANFGTELGLGPGAPCKIAFSKSRVKDIYLMPVVKGISGLLLLMEKLPLHTQRGVVVAFAPLAGLSPKIDENHPMWLHLQIREFDVRSGASKTGRLHSRTSDQVIDGRWTLGFPDAKACEAARSLILEEIRKQRSSVESLLTPLFHNSSRDLSDSQEQ